MDGFAGVKAGQRVTVRVELLNGDASLDQKATAQSPITVGVDCSDRKNHHVTATRKPHTVTVTATETSKDWDTKITIPQRCATTDMGAVLGDGEVWAEVAADENESTWGRMTAPIRITN